MRAIVGFSACRILASKRAVLLLGLASALWCLDVRGDELALRRISSGQGMQGGQVWSLLQDAEGFIWIGTFDSLQRYDGYSFKVFRHDPYDPQSLSSNLVQGLHEDDAGNLWVATRTGGLNRFDRSTERFTRYRHEPDDPASLPDDLVRAVHESLPGQLWVGTAGGLSRLDRDTGRFVHYRHDPHDPQSLSHDDVTVIAEGYPKGRTLWVATHGGGLNLLDRDTGTFVRYRHDAGDAHSLSSDLVASLYVEASGTVWIGTWDAGLNRFDPERGDFTRFRHDPADPRSLSHDGVVALHRDRKGVLWVGTFGGGLNTLAPGTGGFTRHLPDPSNPRSLSQATITRLYGDRSGLLWIGLGGGGVNVLDLERAAIAHYRHDPSEPDSLSRNDVRGVLEDRAGTLWVGTWGGGLDEIDPLTGRVVHHRHDAADPSSLSDSNAYAVHEDRAGTLWVGTAKGLNALDRSTGRFTRYLHDPEDPTSLSDPLVYVLIEDTRGRLWVGTYGGLDRFDRRTGRFHHYQPDAEGRGVPALAVDPEGLLWVGTASAGLYALDPESESWTRIDHDPTGADSVSHHGVTVLLQARDGVMWVGSTGGLHAFDGTTRRLLRRYSLRDGLPSDMLWGILEDDDGFLWLNTTRGLVRLDPRSDEVLIYGENDGFQSDTFLSGRFKSPTGRLYVAGPNGLNAFDPRALRRNPYVPRIALTALELENRPVSVGPDSVLKRSITETEALTLSYRDRVISLELAALDFHAPEKNRYRYRLESFEESWTEVGSDRRVVTYTNLPAGDYVFRATGSNNHGVWNPEGVALRITVTPPWWRTWWLRTAAVLGLAFLLAAAHRVRLRGAERRAEALQQEVDRRQRSERALRSEIEERERAQVALRQHRTELAHMGRVTTLNELSGALAHELNQPLTALLANAQAARRFLASGAPDLDEIREIIDDIIADDKRAAKVVRGMRQLLKKEAPSRDLIDVNEVIDELLKLIYSDLISKHLTVAAHLASGLPAVLGDRVQLQQVLLNLVMNAGEAMQGDADDNGEIVIRSRDNGHGSVEVAVSDQGRGIDEDDLEQIFLPFHTTKKEGMGMGLAINRSIIQAHGGRLWAENNPRGGATFYFTLPIPPVSDAT